MTEDGRDMRPVANLLYEAGHLKRVKRSGWWLAGIERPESVADHSFRVAIIGYALACLEGADPYRIATLCLLHDLGEARTNDAHAIAKKYVDVPSEGHLIRTIAERLPRSVSDRLSDAADALDHDDTLDAQIMRDADALECLIQAREYESVGVKAARSWATSAEARLKTSTARRLAVVCKEVDPTAWWESLLTEPEPVAADNPKAKRSDHE
jgi:putative hydrolases of HD superfamily